MTAARAILRVGLTGGIASGKTTVARLLEGLGALVLDADAIARSAMEPGGSAYDRVVERFGPAILDDQQRIARPRLARIVFRDDEAREALDAIVHPEVLAEAGRRMNEYEPPQGKAAIAVFDAALLVESGLHREFDRLIVVRCSRERQIRRLHDRDGLSADEAERRIDSQAPLSDKLAAADYVIDTEATLRETREQTEGVYAALLADYERMYGGSSAP